MCGVVTRDSSSVGRYVEVFDEVDTAAEVVIEGEPDAAEDGVAVDSAECRSARARMDKRGNPRPRMPDICCSDNVRLVELIIPAQPASVRSRPGTAFAKAGVETGTRNAQPRKYAKDLVSIGVKRTEDLPIKHLSPHIDPLFTDQTRRGRPVPEPRSPRRCIPVELLEGRRKLRSVVVRVARRRRGTRVGGTAEGGGEEEVGRGEVKLQRVALRRGAEREGEDVGAV